MLINLQIIFLAGQSQALQWRIKAFANIFLPCAHVSKIVILLIKSALSLADSYDITIEVQVL
jgi:hypothetical protein